MKIVLFLLLAYILGAFGKKIAANPRFKFEARTASFDMGFTLDDAIREMPEIDSNRRLVRMVSGKCMKYSTKKFPGSEGDWSLLQRFPEGETPLPNGFMIDAPLVTPSLLEKLKPLASQFGFDYFEFERRGPLLSVYWREIGCRRVVVDIYNAFSALDGA